MECAENDDSEQTTNNITVSVTEDGYPQMTNFSDGDFPEFIKKAFEKQGYKKPTPIQSHVWPIAFKGRDIVGIAQTGSGKTLAFSLPAILHICDKKHIVQKDEPTVLILAPTRELVQQINTVFNDFLIESSITNVCIFGGASKESQLYNLDKGFNILIATPGRLIDFLETRCFTLKGCTFLVLDEADRMLDMGFEPQIRTILEEISTERQTLMFSATWPDEVRSLAEEFLSNYVQVNVGGMQLSANHNIKQIVEIIDEGEKDVKLLELLTNIKNEQDPKIIIFASTKARVSELTNNLKNEGFAVISMHGNKSQNEREYALKQFRSGFCPILVATDVAARGLDVDDIKYVINVDYPNSSEDYVHRIGRTGRSNNSGTAYTFFTFQDMKQAKDLVDILTEAKQDIDPALYNLAEMSKTFRCGKGYSGGMSGRYEVNEPKPKKQDNYHKKEQNFRRGNYRNQGHDNYRNQDRDSSRNWGNGNRNWNHGNKNWDHGNKNWDHGNKNWDHGNRNRDHGHKNWNHENKNWDQGNKRNWKQDDWKSEGCESKRNWNRDDIKNEGSDIKRNWNHDDCNDEDRDYRDRNQDNCPKKPRHYQDEKKASPRQNKYQPYDSSNDSNLLLQYIQF
ncbi:unnamed protein product [Larinioides sclopetarius]|uniref:RNA helicase n=2 Tax=Larinioides sclopetarius TaxID=280406 RepID=A0AAV1ZNS8_9ARAC